MALLVQAKQLTGSAFAVGLLGVAELVPLVVFGLYGGVLADRLDRTRLLRWGEAALGLLGALLLVNALLPDPAVWPLYLLAAAITTVSALQRPSFDAAVPRDQLPAAAALLGVSGNTSMIIGTALDAALAAGPGPQLVYGWDTASFVVSLILLTRIRPGRASRRRGWRTGCGGCWLGFTSCTRRGRWGMFAAPSVGALAASVLSGWAGVEMLSSSIGPSAGQLRAGGVASLTSPRVAAWSGGALCVGAVGLVCLGAARLHPVWLPGQPQRCFWRASRWRAGS